MDIRPEYRKKSIRSYVVRAGRMTEAQRKAFDTGWQYGLKLAEGATILRPCSAAVVLR